MVAGLKQRLSTGCLRAKAKLRHFLSFFIILKTLDCGKMHIT